jgi:hypothetical protein
MNARKVWDEAIVYYAPDEAGRVRSILYDGYFSEKSPEFDKAFTQFGRYMIYNAITNVNVAIENDGSI